MKNQKSNVYFFTANKDINILQELKNYSDNPRHDKNIFVCYGTGNKAFKTAMKNVQPAEIVYQIKVSIGKNEILYKY